MTHTHPYTNIINILMTSTQGNKDNFPETVISPMGFNRFQSTIKPPHILDYMSAFHINPKPRA